jgi:hypothetical protein
VSPAQPGYILLYDALVGALQTIAKRFLEFLLEASMSVAAGTSDPVHACML